MNSYLIFIGSTHGFIDDFLKQKEIIELTKPEFVLCEDLENIQLDSKEKFEKIIQNRKISNMTSFNEVEKLINLCYNENIKLIGIDFKKFGFNKNLQNKIKSQEEINKKEKLEINKTIRLRERRHLDKILGYRKKTSRPIIIILGSWHLRENSFLRNKLKNYKLILPCDKKNNLLFKPSDDKNIKYLEIISDDTKNKN